MKCYFVRHGSAVDAGAWNGADFDRPLAPEGRERMTRAAKTFALLHPEIDVVVTSPLLRAKQTAKTLAKRLELDDRLVEDARLGGGFGMAALAEILAEHAAADGLVLVGHEPAMSRTVGELVGSADIEFKPGSVACVRIPDPANLRGTLLWLAPAKILALA